MSDSRDDDIAADAQELATELRALREQLDEQRRRPPTGPLGIPRPPTPREFMEFADEVAIPATIAILETNIRLLEALQRAIRLAEGGRRAGERGRDAGGRARSTAESVSRETLSRASDALADLQSVLEGTDLPENESARSILTEAQDLRREIQEQLTASRTQDRTLDEFEEAEEAAGGDSTDIDVTDGDAENAEADDEPVTIDVDAELETLKQQYEDGSSGGDAAGTDSEEDASDDSDDASDDPKDASAGGVDGDGRGDRSTGTDEAGRDDGRGPVGADE
ncbi:hypothetical protein [Haloarchaeobius sp. FL176]|uniref:DUF7547 family protein n=1 Tax=Haloarchaeobius sp. FL176 TaxID=2967129 RepID=UPI0021491388|nr:hypothetical protein [Haloarchaeobius sp. FL176]